MKQMTMTYEYITPDKAAKLLQKNLNNRRLSPGVVTAYAADIKADNWDNRVGSAISIDARGVLRDGQHRLAAIIQANKGIYTWVCRNVSSDGVYDNNRKRSTSDQLTIIRPDLDPIYRSTLYVSIARLLLTHETGAVGGGGYRRAVTPKEMLDFTDRHKADLDGYFQNVRLRKAPKISITVVHMAMLLAYLNGVSMKNINAFFDILCSGMSSRPEEYPIIALRNYLLRATTAVSPNDPEIGRCQYALKKYLTGSCAKQSLAPKELIYPYVWRPSDGLQ